MALMWVTFTDNGSIRMVGPFTPAMALVTADTLARAGHAGIHRHTVPPFPLAEANVERRNLTATRS